MRRSAALKTQVHIWMNHMTLITERYRWKGRNPIQALAVQVPCSQKGSPPESHSSSQTNSIPDSRRCSFGSKERYTNATPQWTSWTQVHWRAMEKALGCLVSQAKERSGSGEEMCHPFFYTFRVFTKLWIVLAEARPCRKKKSWVSANQRHVRPAPSSSVWN